LSVNYHSQVIHSPEDPCYNLPENFIVNQIIVPQQMGQENIHRQILNIFNIFTENIQYIQRKYSIYADHWPSWQQKHTAVSWSTCHPGHPGPPPQSYIPKVSPKPVLVHGIAPPQAQDPALALVEIHQVPLCPTLQPVQVSLNSNTVF